MTKRLLLSFLVWLAFASSPSTTPAVYGDASGPTGMGYGWTDNQGPNPATTFQWVDIAESGRRVDALSSCDDCFEGGVSIGFDFLFYGDVYATVGINSNGVLQFVDTGAHWGPGRLPHHDILGPALLPLWGDWDPRSNGNIYVQTLPNWPGTNQRAFIVQWDDVENWDCRRGDNATWQVALLEDGGIIYQYLDTVLGELECNYGADMTIGLQQGFGECSVTYSHRYASVPNLAAIFWSPQSSECSSADATSEPVDAPTTTPGQAPSPGQDGSNGPEVVGLPNGGSGPSDSYQSWSPQIAREPYVLIAGVALLLTALGLARLQFRRRRTRS